MGRKNREEMEYEARRTEIRRYRAEKKRAAMKKNVRRTLIFLCVIAILTLAVLSITVFFPVQTISVSGKTIYSSEQIIKASGIRKGDNLFMTGRSAEEEILRSLPYVKQVTLKRKFPATIVLEVIANEAAYCYKTKTGFFVCDQHDKLLKVEEELPKNLLQIIGSTAKKTEIGTNISYEKQEQRKLVLALRAALSEQGIKTTMIDVTDSLDIYLNVDGRFSVSFGSSGNLEQKVAHLAQMVQNIDSELKGNINLSYWSAENPRGIFTQK